MNATVPASLPAGNGDASHRRNRLAETIEPTATSPSPTVELPTAPPPAIATPTTPPLEASATSAKAEAVPVRELSTYAEPTEVEPLAAGPPDARAYFVDRVTGEPLIHHDGRPLYEHHPDGGRPPRNRREAALVCCDTRGYTFAIYAGSPMPAWAAPIPATLPAIPTTSPPTLGFPMAPPVGPSAIGTGTEALPAGEPTAAAIAYFADCGVDPGSLAYHPDAGRPPRNHDEAAMNVVDVRGYEVRVYPGDPPPATAPTVVATSTADLDLTPTTEPPAPQSPGEQPPSLPRVGWTRGLAAVPDDSRTCRPRDHRGQPLDLTFWAQRPSGTVSPVGSSDVDLLLACCWHNREFFEHARRQLRPWHWDPIEVGPAALWHILGEIADANSYPTQPAVLSRVEAYIEQQFGPTREMLPPETLTRIVNPDPAIGLVAYMVATPADAAILVQGRQILQRLAHERGVVMPLRRKLGEGQILGVNGYAHDLTEFLAAVAERAEQVARLSNDRDDKYRMLSTEEFDAAADNVVEIIPGIAVAGQIFIIGGPTKTLKSLIALAFQFSLATRTPLLGNPDWTPTGERKLGVFSAESGPRVLRRKRHLMVDAAVARVTGHDRQAAERERIEAALRDSIVWNKKWLPDFSDAADLKRLTRIIREQHLTDVFVDPLFRALGEIGNDQAKTGAVAKAIGNVHEVVLDAGAELYVCHHTAGDRARKQTVARYQPIELSDLAIPGVTNTVGSWCVVNRAEKYDSIARRNVLWAEFGTRDLGGGGLFKLTIVEGRDHDQWEVSLTPEAECIATERTAADGRLAAAESRFDAAVLRAIRNHPGVTKDGLFRRGPAKVRGVGHATIDGILSRLASRHAIRPVGDGYEVDPSPAEQVNQNTEGAPAHR